MGSVYLTGWEGLAQRKGFEFFLKQNPWLDKKIIKFLDELYLSEFREPWTPGPGICGSIDATYTTIH